MSVFLRRGAVLGAIICTLLFSGSAFAQSGSATTGSISGVVADSSGAILPGVTITAVNIDTGLTRNAVTESDGAYVLNLLQPGRYRVTAELAGLGTSTVPSVTVLLGNATRADVKLTPQVSETLTVTAEAPIVDTTRSGTAQSVTEEQINNLPLLGRDFRSLAQLTPGIANTFGGRITSNGSRGIGTDYNIDGASSNNDFFGEQTGGTRAPFTFSQAAIKEFQVIRAQYSAEYGRGVGATLNAITKSGTNDLDGEAFYFLRKRSWAATRPVKLSNGQTVQESFRARNSSQPGFAVGGPIIHDTLFYFLNGDFQRQKLPIIATDIRTRSAFTTLSPDTQAAFLAKLQTLTGRPYAEGTSYDQTFDQNTYLAKIDWNAGNNNHFSLRDNYSSFENGNNQSSSSDLSNQGTETDKFNQLVGQAETIITSNLFNQALIQYSKDERPVDPVTTNSPEIVVNVGGNVFFGHNDFLPNNTTEKKTQLKDSVQWSLGTHTLKGGAEALLMKIDNLFPRNRSGIFRYSSVADYLADKVNQFNQGFGEGGGLTSWNQNTYGFFVTDNFRVGTKLTVDAGVRYDWQTVPKPATNVFPQHPELIDNFHEDTNNIAPRVGFAYDLFGTGRSVLRGGTGKFYGYMPDILLSNPLTQISGNFNQITLTCATATVVKCPAFPNVLSPDQFNQLASFSSDIVTFGPEYQAQEAWRSSLQFEQQFGPTMSVGIGGIYSKLKHVQGSRNINAVPLGISLGNLPLYSVDTNTRSQRLYTDLGSVRELFSGEEASYRAVTLETHKLALNNSNLSWDLSYTYSRSIDQDSNERSTSSSFLFDPNNPSLSQGRSDSDVPHRIVGDLTYHLPLGFLVSGIGSWRSGVPYTAGIQFTGSGTSANGLNGLSQQSGNIPVFVDSSGNVIDLLAANNFSRAQLVDFLSGARLLQRNTERQPSVWDVDLRLSKLFGLGRGMNLELIGEVFNVLNTKNRFVTSGNQVYYRATYNATTDKYTFTRPTVSGSTAPSFGTVNGYESSVDPRQIQLAAKFSF
ncbi:MAG: carboxypeptidase regulatory-like domain-containing protein [Acidobacteriota bacterium]